MSLPKNKPNELQPCPFCGESEMQFSGPGGFGDPDCFWQCSTCTTTGPNGDSRESATIQWNKRELESQLAQVTKDRDEWEEKWRVINCLRECAIDYNHFIEAELDALKARMALMEKVMEAAACAVFDRDIETAIRELDAHDAESAARGGGEGK